MELDNPRLLALAERLNISVTDAIGILSYAWRFTKLTHNAEGVRGFLFVEFAGELGWDGDYAELKAALLEGGWLEQLPEGTLLQAGWPEKPWFPSIPEEV